MSADEAKATILAIVRDQPEGSSYDQILLELTFHRLVTHGLAADRDRRIATDEIRRRLRTW